MHRNMLFTDEYILTIENRHRQYTLNSIEAAQEVEKAKRVQHPASVMFDICYFLSMSHKTTFL